MTMQGWSRCLGRNATFDIPAIFQSMLTCTPPNLRTLFNQALKIYGDREFYAPERARAKFKKGKLLAVLGHEKEADVCFAEALELYGQVRPGEPPGILSLDDADFDDMITFWSR